MQYSNLPCIDDQPHATYRAFIDTVYDDFGTAKINRYEVRCQLCGEALELIELEIKE